MDQKRLFLAASLSLLVLFTYYSWFGQRSKYSPSDAPHLDEQVVRRQETRAPMTGAQVEWTQLEREEFNLISRETKFLHMVFSPSTADLKAIALRDYIETDADRMEHLTDRAGSPVGTFTLISADEEGEHEWSGFEYRPSEGEVIFSGMRGDLKVIKTFEYHPESRLIWATFRFENSGAVPETLDYETTVSLTADFRNGYDKKFIEGTWLSQDQVKHKGLGNFQKGLAQPGQDLVWSGIRTKYFCLLARPFTAVKTQRFWSAGDSALFVSLRPEPVELAPGESAEHKYLLYAGPQSVEILKKAEHDFVRVVDYGFFGALSTLILAVLRFFHKWFGNWGWAIVLLSIVIKIVLHPLTEKSLKSMREIQHLQPELNKLKEKYQSDPQKLNRAMLDFYKEHKVNPLGGCLPILFQMPVFFALYNALIRAVELRGARFVFWIKDLSQPDKFLTFSGSLPVVGNSVHLLPILMGLATILQQKLSSTQGAQTEQQLAMAIMMPIMLTLIFYNLPSGLVLYWTTNTLLTVIHQYRVARAK